MADVWYYAQNGQQAGPVSASQLQQLARSGQIQATDLVWKEGLPQWIQAKAIKGLFPAQPEPSPGAPAAPADRVPGNGWTAKTVSAPDTAPESPAGRPGGREYVDADRDRGGRRRDREFDDDDDRPRRRRREAEDDDDYDRPRRRPARAEDDDEDYDRPRRRRKAAGGWEGLPTGAKIGIMAGGLVLIIAAIAVPVILFMSGGGVSNPGPNGWVTPALRPGQQHDKVMNFDVGDQVEITSKGNRGRMGDPAFDVDLHVLGPNNFPVTADISVGPDSRVNFRAPVTGAYTIRVVNVSMRGSNAVTSTVNVKVTKANPPPVGEKKAAIKPPQFGGGKGGDIPPFGGNKDGIAKKDGLPPFGGNKDGVMKKDRGRPFGGGGIDDGNKTWNDQLTLNEPFDRMRKQMHHKVYTYRMKAGTIYTIRMQAITPGFDPYLRLENAAHQPLAEDDDGDGFPNAKIVYTCPQAGTYRIIATTFGANMTGNYTLSVSPGQ